MRPGRETDVRVAQEIFGHPVRVHDQVPYEASADGEHPLRPYSQEMGFAWAVAEKLRISVLPVEGNQWFAFAGGSKGWPSPQDFLRYLEGGDFSECGAAVGPSAAAAICEAALKVIDKRKINEAEMSAVLAPEASEPPILQ